jgi:hypothetical protein
MGLHHGAGNEEAINYVEDYGANRLLTHKIQMNFNKLELRIS